MIPRVLGFGVFISAVFPCRRGVYGVLVCSVDMFGRGAWVEGWRDAGVDCEGVEGTGARCNGIGDVLLCCVCARGGSVSDGGG